MSKMISHRKAQEPPPGSSSMVFLPNQPNPARSATARSARGLLSTKTRAATGRPTKRSIRATNKCASSFKTSW
jgi:hypothetical protein